MVAIIGDGDWDSSIRLSALVWDIVGFTDGPAGLPRKAGIIFLSGEGVQRVGACVLADGCVHKAVRVSHC